MGVNMAIQRHAQYLLVDSEEISDDELPDSVEFSRTDIAESTLLRSTEALDFESAAEVERHIYTILHGEMEGLDEAE